MNNKHPFHSDIDYVFGEKLFGDDYTLAEINQWYHEESKSYDEQFRIDANVLDNYKYQYNSLNRIVGFDKIDKQKKIKNILSFGGALGYEIESLIPYAENIYIIEPSKVLRRQSIFGKTINYCDPTINGKIDFPDGFFDIITCFGVLMYIPNVTFVLEELYRCLGSNGYLLIREPITSLGIGQSNRPGCGHNTRGIPLNYFRSWIAKHHFSHVITTFHMFGPLIKILSFCKIEIYNNIITTKLDVLISRLFSFNYKYTRNTIKDKFAPGSVFLVLKK